MTNPDGRNAIVLLIDGLNPAFLSPYGCTWIKTPAFDELASQSVLFERAVCETVDSDDSIWSFFSGRHPGSRSPNSAESSPEFPMLSSCREQNIECLLFTDQPESCQEFEAAFDQVLHMPLLPPENDFVSARDIADTHLAKCFAMVLTELPNQTSPFLSVIHLSSLTRIWDAPIALRQNHRDEDDPEALDVVRPMRMQGDFDPDNILGVSQAYAAQLETLDTCLDVLMQELRLDGMLEDTLFVVAGLRGFPVGHQKHIGHYPDHLGSDATCVPLFVRSPDSCQKSCSAIRSHDLTSVSEWFDLVHKWLLGEFGGRLAAIIEGGGVDIEPVSDSRSKQEFIVVCGENSQAIWTPAWFLVEPRSLHADSMEGDRRSQLFVKPEDRWDVNPVQDRCRWIAEELSEVLERACKQIRENQPLSIEPLADELVFGMK